MASGRSSALKYIISRVRLLPWTMAREETNSIDTTPTPPIRRISRRKSRSVTPAMGASQSGGSMRRGPICTIGGDFNPEWVKRISGPRIPLHPLPHRAPQPQRQQGRDHPPLETSGGEAPGEQRLAVQVDVGEADGEVDPGDDDPPADDAPGAPDRQDDDGMDQEADDQGRQGGSARGAKGHAFLPSAARRNP